MVLIFGRVIPDRVYKCIVEKIGKYMYVFLVIFAIILVILFLASFVLKYDYNVNIVYIDLGAPLLHIASNKFLSVALDASVIANGFKNLRLRDPRVVELMQPLAPGYWRIGGNLADRLIFTPDGTFLFKYDAPYYDGGDCSYAQYFCRISTPMKFTMSGKEWLQLNKVASEAGFEIVFDLNVLNRYKTGSWDPTNAKVLLDFSDTHNLSVHWELGNEPNAFPHQFNVSVKPRQLGKDFKALRKLLNSYPRYKKSLLVGPDVTRPLEEEEEEEEEGSIHYLTDFLKTSKDVIDAVTWHQYYFNGRYAKPHYYVSYKVFDDLKWEIQAIKNITRSVSVKKSIWLGETADAWGGGADNLSNSFISTFIWLDKLGLAAKMGLDVVIRQSMFEGNYALVDKDLFPTPNWWISVIYKQLVGPQVVNCYSATTENVRLYCHCHKNDTNSIIVFGVNMQEYIARVRFETEDGVYPYRIDAYFLTPYISLFSSKIRLNGIPLQLTADYKLPPITPTKVPGTPYVMLPPYSLSFLRIHIKEGNTPCIL